MATPKAARFRPGVLLRGRWSGESLEAGGLGAPDRLHGPRTGSQRVCGRARRPSRRRLHPLQGGDGAGPGSPRTRGGHAPSARSRLPRRCRRATWPRARPTRSSPRILRLLAKRPKEPPGRPPRHSGTGVARGQPRFGRGPPADAPLPLPTGVRRSGRGRAWATQHRRRGLALRSTRRIAALSAGASGGKTRVIMELARFLELNGVAVITGQCRTVGVAGVGEDPGVQASPLAPFRPLLSEVADVCLERGPAETERLLGTRTELLTSIEPALASLPHRPRARGPTPTPATHWALASSKPSSRLSPPSPGAAGRPGPRRRAVGRRADTRRARLGPLRGQDPARSRGRRRLPRRG